jgi:hypothetical protein
MNSQELRVITAVAILAGTLVIGLEHLSSQATGNPVQLTQANPNVRGPGSASDQRFGDPSGAINARDNSRLDTRQTPGFSGSSTPPAGPTSGIEQGSADFDSRRDNSRLDTRQERRISGPSTGPSNEPR